MTTENKTNPGSPAWGGGCHTALQASVCSLGRHSRTSSLVPPFFLSFSLSGDTGQRRLGQRSRAIRHSSPLLPPLDQLLPVGQEVAEGAALFALLCGWRAKTRIQPTTSSTALSHDGGSTVAKQSANACLRSVCAYPHLRCEKEIGKCPSSLTT